MSLLECLCKQLQDDDSSVRREAARCWNVIVTLVGPRDKLAVPGAHPEEISDHADASGDPQQRVALHAYPSGNSCSDEDSARAMVMRDAAAKALRATVGDELYGASGGHLITIRATQALKGLLHFFGE